MDLLPNNAIDNTISRDKIKNICVIGGGAGGLAALKIISDSQQYQTGLWKPIAFESRDTTAGIWAPAPPEGNPPLTPLYDSLTTNLPHPVMASPQFWFPPSTPLFPHANVVEHYLKLYAEHFDLNKHIQLNAEVLSADWDNDTSLWTVRTSDGAVRTFDLLIVANGHYRTPRIPDTVGVAEWVRQGKATHSVYYRHPENLGDTVLVVGGGPSGQDISTEMRTTASTVIHSVTGAANEDVETPEGILKRRPRVAQYLSPSEGRVRFVDGTEETGITHCILATGYEYTYPFFSPSFLKPGVPPPCPPLPTEFYNSSYHLFPLARHLWPLTASIPPSRLAFLGLAMRVVPFPLMEAQMRAVLHAFAHPEALDPAQEAVGIIARYEDLRARATGGEDPELSVAKAWVRFHDEEQFAYRDELHVFAHETWRVPDWLPHVYMRKDVLRAEWRALEKTGEADAWVKGVGEGPDSEREWVEMMERLIKRIDDRGRIKTTASWGCSLL